MADSFMGAQQFVTLRNPSSGERGGIPELPMEMCEVITRPGVDGESVVKIGKKGVPFQLVSGRDALDAAACVQFVTDYKDMIGTVVGLNWNGISHTANYGVQFVVLSVHDINWTRIGASVGGIETNPQYWITAVWDLLGFEL